MELLQVLERLKQEQPEVAVAIGQLRETILSHAALDAKTANLVSIGIAAALRNAEALKGHIHLARAAGATREEITGAILLSLPSAGIPGALAALGQFWEQETPAQGDM